METIEALVARVAIMVNSVDLENDIDEELAYGFANAEKSGTELTQYIRKLWVLNHRRQITVQEYRRLLGAELKKDKI